MKKYKNKKIKCFKELKKKMDKNALATYGKNASINLFFVVFVGVFGFMFVTLFIMF